MLKEIKILKNEFDSIPVPPELDLSIEKGLHRGRRKRLVKLVARPLEVGMTVFLVFILSLNLSPALASYLNGLGMEPLVQFFTGDKGVSRVLELGYGQIIGNSATDKGITLTVETAVYDGQQLTLIVRVDCPDGRGACPEESKLRGYAGPIAFWLCPALAEDDDSITRYCFQYNFDGDELREKQVFFCDGIRCFGGYQAGLVRGCWSVPFILDTDLAELGPREIFLDEEVAIGDFEFTVCSLKIYPLVVEVELSLAPDNPVNFYSFKNPRLIDANGVEYYAKPMQEFPADDLRVTLFFESPLFAKATGSSYILAFDGVYTMSKEEVFFILDYENEKITDESGLGIEFCGKNFDEFDGGEFLCVWFKPTAKEYRENGEQFLSLKPVVYDLEGNGYSAMGPLQRDFPGRGREYGVAFKVSEGVPCPVKVIVSGVSTGVIEPVWLEVNIGAE